MEPTKNPLDEGLVTGDYEYPHYKLPEDKSSPSMISSNTLGQPVFLQVNDSSTTVNLDKKNDFVEQLDCTQFTSSEIIVKLVGGDIIVEAEQEDQNKGENGPLNLNKTFHNVSDLYDLEKAKAWLDLDKVLTLYAPRKDKKAVDEESPSDMEESGKSLINVGKEIQKEN